jgi:hypothetical protein
MGEGDGDQVGVSAGVGLVYTLRRRRSTARLRRCWLSADWFAASTLTRSLH